MFAYFFLINNKCFLMQIKDTPNKQQILTFAFITEIIAVQGIPLKKFIWLTELSKKTALIPLHFVFCWKF